MLLLPGNETLRQAWEEAAVCTAVSIKPLWLLKADKITAITGQAGSRSRPSLVQVRSGSTVQTQTQQSWTWRFSSDMWVKPGKSKVNISISQAWYLTFICRGKVQDKEKRKAFPPRAEIKDTEETIPLVWEGGTRWKSYFYYSKNSFYRHFHRQFNN